MISRKISPNDEAAIHGAVSQAPPMTDGEILDMLKAYCCVPSGEFHQTYPFFPRVDCLDHTGLYYLALLLRERSISAPLPNQVTTPSRVLETMAHHLFSYRRA